MLLLLLTVHLRLDLGTSLLFPLVNGLVMMMKMG